MAQFSNGEQAYSYDSFGKQVLNVSALLDNYKVSPTANVAILAENMPNWTVAFFAVASAGRVAVPILPGSTAFEVDNILNHSESEALFVSRKQLPKIADLLKMKAVILIDDFSTVSSQPPSDAHPLTSSRPEITDQTLATIIYTSGTTGNAKGVMLSHGNLYHSVVEAKHAQPASCNDRWLSILPMAHAYEMAFGMLYPLSVGATVYYLREMPTPSILIPTMKKVRPTIICSVPLVAEKLHKAILRRIDESPKLKAIQKHAPWLMFTLIGITLKKQTGGKIKFFGIGGAKLNPEVEEFLKKSHFNYAIGYGTTETAPLITNACVHRTKVGSIGVPAYGVEVDLADLNPKTGIGEIIAKGPNVMLGYFKDPERTASVLSQDGWYHTGDLACRDKLGRLYIKGRLGSMILGPSGENIYPEEIEQVLNTYPSVIESLVVKRGKQLVALIQLDENFKARLNKSLNTKLNELTDNIREFVNKRVSVQSQIALVQLMDEPFKKTATLKIRRYLYQ
ncbi:MAG: AMP-binding protein [Bacteroidales bacterium]|nr:AMP-binding protein [Bacteroidales bacterium]